MTSGDAFGYGAMRTQVARYLGVTVGEHERLWPDDVLHQFAVEAEARGRAITREDFVSCLTCTEPTHLTLQEWEVCLDLLNSTHYWGFDTGEALLYRRANVSTTDASRAWKAVGRINQINRDRCVAAKTRTALKGATT